MRTLRKRYLLRFKGGGIFWHTIFIATMFALLSALLAHRILGTEPMALVTDTVEAAIAIALVSFAPLRLAYRFIQRQPLYVAVILTLLLAAGAAYVFTFAVLVFSPNGLLSSLPWSADPPRSAALEVAAITLVGYALVIQIAVATRREGLARRMNMSNRLKALQARMRPHFFFNTLNSVASLIRSDPELAEKAIEDLADVFRVVIRAEPKLVSLAEDIEIAKQYMDIEKLRLGERLKVEWHISEDAMNARIPSLTLQPLLENAVYHGIEPSMPGGTITVDCSCDEGRLHILVTNPVPEIKREKQRGSKTALSNIKERLKRQFGGDVRINIRDTKQRFNISINAPLLHATAAK